MSRNRHTEAQTIGMLKQLEAGRKAEDVAREVGVSKHTIYAWKAKYIVVYIHVGSAGFRVVASVRFGLALFPVPARRTGQADFPHPALGKDARRHQVSMECRLQ